MIEAGFISMTELPLKYIQNSITNNLPQPWDFTLVALWISPLDTTSNFLPKLPLLHTDPHHPDTSLSSLLHLPLEVALK